MSYETEYQAYKKKCEQYSKEPLSYEKWLLTVVQKAETNAVLFPFYIIAKEMLSMDLRGSRTDDIVVYQCNNKQLTIGDCRKLVNFIEK